MFEGVRNESRRNWRTVGGAIMLSGTLALNGCSDHSKAAEEGSASNSNSMPSDVSIDNSGSPIPMTFDALGGGSPYIEVYPGVTTQPRDETYDATCNDGDQVMAVCKELGRLVYSHPEKGELQRSSKEWVKLATPGPKPQFATEVYVKDPDSLNRQLPDC